MTAPNAQLAPQRDLEARAFPGQRRPRGGSMSAAPRARLGLVALLTLSLHGVTGCADARPDTFRYDAGPSGDAGVDQGPTDLGTSDDQGTSTHPARYPADRTLSPITPHVAAHLREVVARGSTNPDVFIKVGASATRSTSFLHCFAGSNVDLDGRTELEGALDHFRSGDIEGSTPFNRTSLSTEVGRGAAWAIAGDPSPLESEVAIANPRYAVAMYGTNDIEQTNVFAYANSLLDLSDQLLDEGIIPIWSSIMPRDDNATSDLRVPEFNMAVRAVAQARQVPFVDLHRELLPLPEHGLGPDNLHPSAFSGGACQLTADGLLHGYNVRNLITLQALARALDAVEGRAAPDPAGEPIAGVGSPSAPFEITALPFSHVASTLFSTNDLIDTYPGCGSTTNEAGPEYYYRLVLVAPARVRVLVFDRGNVDIDVHHLSGTSGADCLARDHQDLTLDLGAGTHYFALDTYVDAGGVERAGEYILAIFETP